MIDIYKKRFDKISLWFRNHKKTLDLMKFCYLILPIVTAVSYVLLLAFTLIHNDLFSTAFLKTLLVPAGVFLLVTAIRSVLNFPRPYEMYDTHPLFPKSTKGHSFPSRHTASIFIIAMTFLYTNAVLGVIFLIFALLIGLTRFLSGVHFFRDVLVGALISIICGIIFLFII